MKTGLDEVAAIGERNSPRGEAIVDSARYGESGPAMVTPESLDEVCHTYFLAG